MNEMRENWEKKRGIGRSVGSFRRFNDFIHTMNMEEVRFVGREWTWANNRVGEGFVEKHLDRFFAYPSWHYQFPNAIVNHIQKQVSDNSLLILETKPNCQSNSKWFYFDKRFIELSGFDQTVLDAWNQPQFGNPMFQVCEWIKQCRISLLKLKGTQRMNSGKVSMDIKRQMALM